jgi:beta-glucanase (GH16 family)
MFAGCRPLGALALLSLIAIQFAAAQVTTDCQPLDGACPPDPAFGMDHMFHFNATPSQDVWEEKVRGVKYDREQGAIFTINQQGDAPTLRSKFYFFWGRTELIMKAAPGKGIVSSMMWLSDDLDEVDWEFLGMNTSMAASNYFSKGVEDFTKGKYHVQPFNNQDDYHNYTCIWTKDRLDWLIDGNLVRTLLAKDANDTLTYPQTPMRLSLGIWAGGDPRMPENTRQWAGGDTDYGAGPYTMYVKSVRVTDFTQNAKQYEYGDRSGSWESIKIVE